MARKSPAALAADLWRSGSLPPKPPDNLRGVARTYWTRLASSKPCDHWSGAGPLLLARLCQTLATAECIQKQLDADPAAPNAMQLIKALTGLNASAAQLATKLRLVPQAVIGPRETGRNAEPGPPDDALIGGHALRQ